MSKRELLNATQKAEIADLYRTGEYSQGDLGVMYVVSATTIRRTLYEFNLCTFNSEVTSKERSFLEAIKALNIQTVDQLRALVTKGLQC